jgi:hypothetical protein
MNRKLGHLLAMTCAVAVLDAGVLAHAQAAKAHEQAQVSGRWVLAIKGGPHGDTTMGLTLKQEGSKVTGTFASPHGDVPVTGEFADHALELATVVRSADDPSVTFKAKLKDDGTLAGYLSSQMGDMSFTAERAKDK